MFRRICLPVLLAAAPAFARDWAAHPAVVELRAPETMYALGDIDGDFDRLVTLLRAAKIADDGSHWSAGNAVFVVTGDMIGPGPKPLEVVRLLVRLQIEAKSAGGDVVVLAGDHEVEFLNPWERDPEDEFGVDLKRAGYTIRDVAACRTDIGEFLCGLPFAARVGDWFFLHGGNTAGRTIQQLSADIAGGVDRDGYSAPTLTSLDGPLTSRLSGHPDRWIGLQNEAHLLEEYAKALGVRHIVQGHEFNGLRFSDGLKRKEGQMYGYHDLLFLIDCGMSRMIDRSHGAILKVTSGSQFEAIYPEAPFTRPL